MSEIEIKQLLDGDEQFYPQTDLHALVNDGEYAIDDVPTIDSSNLVKSEGVYDIMFFYLNSFDDYKLVKYNTSTNRIAFVFKLPSASICFSVKNVPSGYLVTTRVAETAYDAANAINIGELINWTNEINFATHYPNNYKYFCVAFRNSSNTALDDNDLAAVKQSDLSVSSYSTIGKFKSGEEVSNLSIQKNLDSPNENLITSKAVADRINELRLVKSTNTDSAVVTEIINEYNIKSDSILYSADSISLRIGGAQYNRAYFDLVDSILSGRKVSISANRTGGNNKSLIIFVKFRDSNDFVVKAEGNEKLIYRIEENVEIIRFGLIGTNETPGTSGTIVTFSNVIIEYLDDVIKTNDIFKMRGFVTNSDIQSSSVYNTSNNRTAIAFNVNDLTNRRIKIRLKNTALKYAFGWADENYKGTLSTFYWDSNWRYNTDFQTFEASDMPLNGTVSQYSILYVKCAYLNDSGAPTAEEFINGIEFVATFNNNDISLLKEEITEFKNSIEQKNICQITPTNRLSISSTTNEDKRILGSHIYTAEEVVVTLSNSNYQYYKVIINNPVNKAVLKVSGLLDGGNFTAIRVLYRTEIGSSSYNTIVNISDTDYVQVRIPFDAKVIEIDYIIVIVNPQQGQVLTLTNLAVSYDESSINSFGDMSYYGERIVLNKRWQTNMAQSKLLFSKTWAETPELRGINCMDIWNDNIFLIREIYNSASDHTFRCFVYSLLDYSYQFEVSCPEVVSGHMNSCQFTDVFYDDNDNYPIMIASSAETTSNGPIYVLRLVENNGVYSFVLLKTITCDVPDHFIGTAYIDEKSNSLWYSAYTNTDYNYFVLHQFDLPSLIDNTDTVLTDVKCKYKYGDGGQVAIQDGQIIDGKLYFGSYRNQAFGGFPATVPHRCIIVIDLTNGNVVNMIPNSVPQENEGLCIKDNIMYVCSRNDKNQSDMQPEDITFWLHKYEF